MIFTLTESAMNGTITLSARTTLIEADSFEEAYEKLKKFPNWNKVENIVETSDGVRYTMGKADGKTLPCSGFLSSKPTQIV
jgi:hypothetical protein